jgi:DNA-3-methyladenine glycosylase I
MQSLNLFPYCSNFIFLLNGLPMIFTQPFASAGVNSIIVTLESSTRYLKGRDSNHPSICAVGLGFIFLVKEFDTGMKSSSSPIRAGGKISRQSAEAIEPVPKAQKTIRTNTNFLIHQASSEQSLVSTGSFNSQSIDMERGSLKNGFMKNRCSWAQDPLNAVYHDKEWGRPVHDDQVLFEFIVLEGAQAGLSWITVLKKRENYRRAFAAFDPKKVARFDAKKIKALMNDEGIIRNRLKIESTISNAKAFLQVQKEFGSFDKYIWQFVGGKPIVTRRNTLRAIPAATAQSDAMSKDLKKRGFRFVGTTICYAFMQACGLVNDHVDGCFKCIAKK